MTLRAARFTGALSILGVGAVHLQQYATGYSAIPTIGTLFVLNAISAGLVGLGLLLPLHRALGPRRGNGAVGVLALAGVTIALGSLAALFISETGTLFGFSEDGYDTPIVIAIAVEVLATVLLTPLAAISVRRAVAQPAHRAQRPRRPAGYGVSRSAETARRNSRPHRRGDDGDSDREVVTALRRRCGSRAGSASATGLVLRPANKPRPARDAGLRPNLVSPCLPMRAQPSRARR